MSKGGRTSHVLLLQKAHSARSQNKLKEAFQKADVHGTGQLSTETYRKVLKENRLSLSPSEIEDLMAIADKNRDGFISLSEFTGVTDGGNRKGGGSKTKSELDRANRAFSIFDSDNDGYITKQEFLRHTSKLTEQQVSLVISRMDQDGDGKLNREEFRKLLARRSSK